MKPPADRRLDLHGAGTDHPISGAAPRYGVRRSAIFLTASVLGLASTVLAWRFSLAVGVPDTHFGTLLFLNFTYWYLWALFTPAIVWLSQHFRFEWHGLTRAVAVHLPSVLLFSLTHIALMAGVQWWLAVTRGRAFDWWGEVQRSSLLYLDWEMMTYWAIVGLSHAVLYYRESRDRAVRAAQLETRLVAAELHSLQQQLHPHFLFNALNAVSALMYRDVEEADRTLARLSDLLRLSLEYSGVQEIPLRSEIEFLTRYVQIEQTRFGDALSVRFDVAPEAQDGIVPALLLQPLVENAIKHGVANAGHGQIDITARRHGEKGDKLVIEVRDDGAGLSEDAFTALQKGIGVSTTRARLQHLYGAEFRFEFHRRTKGLSVLVALPWRTTATPPRDLNGARQVPADAGTDLQDVRKSA